MELTAEQSERRKLAKALVDEAIAAPLRSRRRLYRIIASRDQWQARAFAAEEVLRKAATKADDYRDLGHTHGND